MSISAIRTLVVGVDIGLTGTGVAFAHYPTDPPWDFRQNIQHIQEWPPFGVKQTNKVPTVVAFRKGKVLKKWGFECDPDLLEKESGYKRKEYFKLYLDESLRSEVFKDTHIPNTPTKEHIREWYQIFLTGLYNWIQQVLESKYPDYKKHLQRQQVQYIFSVPTTWSPETTAVLHSIVLEAGFGSLPNQTAEIGLTEAEAAAVYSMEGTAREIGLKTDLRDPKKPYVVVQEDLEAPPAMQFSKGDTLLMVDAGGGTTDVTVLEIKSHEDGMYGLEQLCVVEGAPIGSVQIDDKVQQIIENHLEESKTKLNLKKFDMERAIGAFQDIKHDVGLQRVDMLDEFVVQIQKEPGVAVNRDGQIRIKMGYLHAAFDFLLEGIMELIDHQLKEVNRNVEYLVLSGGLGSSKYVAKRLYEEYSGSMKLFTSDDPQLAVCRGLVIDRLHRLANNTPMIIRKCRASYGILYDELYDRVTHKPQKPWRNPLDGKDYAKDQIKWLIDKDAKITEKDEGTLRHKTSRRIPYEFGRTMEWKETIMRYDGDLNDRPKYRKHAKFLEDEKSELEVVGVIPCVVVPGLNDGAVTKKHKRWFRIGSTKYWKIKYEIRLRIGPADIGCALWYMDAQVGAGESIQADWDPEPADGANGGYGANGTNGR